MPITSVGERIDTSGHDGRISEADVVVVFFCVKDIAIELSGFVGSIGFSWIVAAIFDSGARWDELKLLVVVVFVSGIDIPSVARIFTKEKTGSHIWVVVFSALILDGSVAVGFLFVMPKNQEAGFAWGGDVAVFILLFLDGVFGAELDELVQLAILALEGFLDRNGDDWNGVDVFDLGVGAFLE